jgi:CO dehydrogenase/acetyl-CoA synthase alpha subunit
MKTLYEILVHKLKGERNVASLIFKMEMERRHKEVMEQILKEVEIFIESYNNYNAARIKHHFHTSKSRNQNWAWNCKNCKWCWH